MALYEVVGHYWDKPNGYDQEIVGMIVADTQLHAEQKLRNMKERVCTTEKECREYRQAYLSYLTVQYSSLKLYK